MRYIMQTLQVENKTFEQIIFAATKIGSPCEIKNIKKIRFLEDEIDNYKKILNNVSLEL